MKCEAAESPLAHPFPMPASRTSPRPEKQKKLPRRPAVEQAPRNPEGKFVKGFSGNPSGARVIPAEIRELAREFGPAAILRLASLMRSDDEAIVIAACRELLNRGYGRPESTINLPNGGALVNVNMLAASGPIKVTTAEEADAAYRAIMGDPKFDFSRIEWAPSAPVAPPEDVQAPPESGTPTGEQVPYSSAAPAPPSVAAAPASNVASLDDARQNLWVKLGQ